MLLFSLLLVPGPQIITHPTDTSAAAPFSAMFTCSARGYGYLNITWYKNNKFYNTITDKSTIHQTSSIDTFTSTLVIYNVIEDDIGVYHCLVWDRSKASQSRTGELFFSGTLCSCDAASMLLSLAITFMISPTIAAQFITYVCICD